MHRRLVATTGVLLPPLAVPPREEKQTVDEKLQVPAGVSLAFLPDLKLQSGQRWRTFTPVPSWQFTRREPGC